MRRSKFCLLAAILAGLLLSNPVLATTNMQLTIINNSGYPDSQVYLAWLGNPGNDAANSYHITNWQNIAIAINSTGDNTVHFPGELLDGYANYSTSLDQLNINTAGRRYFELPPCFDSTTPKGIATSRLWLSLGKPLYFHIYSSTSNSQPSGSDQSEINYYTLWDFFEFNTSFNVGPDKFSSHANTTNVDYFAMPLVYELYNDAARVGIKGISHSKLEVYQAFSTAASALRPLMTSMRVIAPGHGNPTPGVPLYFDPSYFDSYRDYCWSYWDGSTEAKTIKFTYSGVSWENGKVNQTTKKLSINAKVGGSDEAHEIDLPPSGDIFRCDGVFNGVGTDAFFIRDAAVKNMIASALNRSVMHKAVYPDPIHPTEFPWGASISDYYVNNDHLASFKTNTYSHVLHQVSLDGTIYGFAYDDNNHQSSYVEGLGTEIRLTINNSRMGGLSWLELLLE
jgi:hypothetical protein